MYPNTPVGASDVTTSASCEANAAVNPGASLSITCNTDGTYSGSPNCSCAGGYLLTGETCTGEIMQWTCICANVYVKSKHELNNFTLITMQQYYNNKTT